MSFFCFSWQSGGLGNDIQRLHEGENDRRCVWAEEGDAEAPSLAFIWN